MPDKTSDAKCRVTDCDCERFCAMGKSFVEEAQAMKAKAEEHLRGQAIKGDALLMSIDV